MIIDQDFIITTYTIIKFILSLITLIHFFLFFSCLNINFDVTIELLKKCAFNNIILPYDKYNCYHSQICLTYYRILFYFYKKKIDYNI